MGATTDRQGNLWLATSQGAVRYDGQHWTTFDAADGLADNQVFDVLEDHEGNIWFATAKGVTRYRPDTRPPQTRMVRGPEGTVGYGTSVLTFEFEGGDWEWEQRSLTFSYALMKEGRKLEEGDWSEWDAQKFVQVPLPGDGHFTFHVRTRDKALNVDPTPATHVFYIAPPLWKVLWFQVSTGFGLLLIVFSSGYALRKRRQAYQVEQHARQVEQRLFAEMERELQTAHEMQMALMPKAPPRIAGFEITGRCMPANHVGGDLFQYFQQNGKLSISLADVTGHAMEAAIPVVMFSGVLEAQMETGGTVEELFTRLNRSLHRTLIGHTFVCFALGELDLSTRVFRFSDAGCPYPYHYRAATGEVTELRVDAYPLGVRPDTTYRVIEIQLEPGDRVVFCSDGIIEATNAGGEMFGFERTAEVVRRGCAEDLSAEALLARIIQEVKAFSGEVPQGDDQTAVVLKVER